LKDSHLHFFCGDGVISSHPQPVEPGYVSLLTHLKPVQPEWP